MRDKNMVLVMLLFFNTLVLIISSVVNETEIGLQFTDIAEIFRYLCLTWCFACIFFAMFRTILSETTKMILIYTGIIILSASCGTIVMQLV